MLQTEPMSRYRVRLDEEHQKETENQLETDSAWCDVLLVEKKSVLEVCGAYLTMTVFNSLEEGNYEYISEPDVVEDLRNVSVSTADQQRILSENSASFCTITLLFDEKGNSFLWHYPLADWVKEGKLSESKSNRMKQFLQFHKQLEGDSKRLLITATNVHEQARKAVENSVAEVELGDVVVTGLFTSSSKQPDLVAQKPGFSLNAESIEGLIYVPPRLSKDGKTKIFLLYIPELPE